MANFVLIHGAWHGGWCWQRVIPILERAGHTALGPDLPGMGDDPNPIAEATLDRWADRIADIARARAGKIILVGHSRGGPVITHAAPRIADRLAALVYLTARLVPPGRTMDSMQAAFPRPALMASSIVASPDGTYTTFDPAHAREIFYNTTPPEWADWALARVGREPTCNATTPIAGTMEGLAAIPRVYIECLRDQAIPLATQRGMRDSFPMTAIRALDCDHSPFLSMPENLAAALEEIAATYGG